MNNLEIITTKRLRILIDETDEALHNLKIELERRESAHQEREIADLESHMESAELSLKTIRDFFAFLVREIRKER